MYLTDLEKQEDQLVHSNGSSYTSVITEFILNFI